MLGDVEHFFVLLQLDVQCFNQGVSLTRYVPISMGNSRTQIYSGRE